MRAAAYLRATMPERANEEEVLREQRRRAEKYVSERGWELAEVYEDAPSRSAFAADRPGLARLIDERDRYERLVIVSVERLRPSARAAFQLLKRFEDQGVEVVSLDDGFDTGEESGRAAVRMLSLAADWEMHAESREGWKPENLRKPGLDPATVFDVGAGAGTPTLYQAFPDARHVLVEPLEEFASDLREVVAAYRGEHVLSAAGSSEGTVTFNVERDGLLLSSILRRVADGPSDVEQRTVRVTTLDALRSRLDLQPPFGIKIDAEGYEGEVIEGASGLLPETQFVIAEVSLRPDRFDVTYSFAEFVALMDRHGFRLCDILDAPRLKRARELQFVDAMFRRAEDRPSEEDDGLVPARDAG
jgi:FkbM family methyltransferase